MFFNPGPFTIFLSAVSVYSLDASLCSSNKFNKIMGIVLFIAAIPIVLITLSRSAWLGLIAGGLLVFTVRFQLLQKLNRWCSNTIIKAIGLFMLFFVIFLSGFCLYHLKKDSADGRKLIWKISSNIIHDSPFNGIGQDRFAARFIEYQSAYFKENPDRISTEGRLSGTAYYAFNDVLQITVEQGITGSILFLVVMLITSKYCRSLINSKHKTPIDRGTLIGAMASIVVIGVSGLTAYPLVMLPIIILFFNALGIISAAYSNTFSNSPFIKPGNKIFSAIVLISAASLIFYSLALGRVYYIAKFIVNNGYENDPEVMIKLMRYRELIRTEEWYVTRQCDYLLNKEQYQKAVMEMEKAKQVTANSAIYYSLAEVYTYQRQYYKAEKQLMFLYYALPGLIAPKYYLAKFYYRTNQKKKWHNAAIEVIRFNPKINSNTTTEMINDIKKLYFKY